MTMDSTKMTSPKKGKIPAWAKAPFDDFGDHIIEIGDVLQMACAGIAMLRGRPQAIEAVTKARRVLGEDEPGSREHQLEEAKRQAELAQNEVEKGFPLLHAQAVITLWGALEALVKNFLAALISNEPDIRKADVLRKVKITFWEYEEMDPLERSLYMVGLLDREVTAPLKQGASRFEILLDVFGFGGAVEDAVGRDLYEMNQIRNTLVHHRGLIDRRLVEGCPWLGLSLGERVVVKHRDFDRYYMSSTKYYFVLLNRMRARYGADPIDPFAEEPSQEPTTGS